MYFKSDMSEKEYLRDSNYRDTPDLEKDVLAEQKKINDLTWEYITLDNYYDNNNSYKNHSYYYETYDGKYYTTYIIQFNKVDNMEEFENDFIKNIVFE